MCCCPFYCCKALCNQAGKAGHHRDIDWTATIRSLVMVSLAVINFFVQYNMLDICDTYDLAHTDCRFEWWALDNPDDSGVPHVVNIMTAYVVLGVLSVWGFFVLSMGCEMYHRTYAIFLVLNWIWLMANDVLILMNLNDSYDNCKSLTQNVDRCEHQWNVRWYQTILLTWMQTIILLNTAYDGYTRHDQLSNREIELTARKKRRAGT